MTAYNTIGFVLFVHLLCVTLRSPAKKGMHPKSNNHVGVSGIVMLALYGYPLEIDHVTFWSAEAPFVPIAGVDHMPE